VGQNPYSPHTDADRAAMLARIGITSVDELLAAVPADARGPAMGVPAGLSEAEIQVHMERLAALDRTAGAGVSDVGLSKVEVGVVLPLYQSGPERVTSRWADSNAGVNLGFPTHK